eukprot:1138619-Pyramimonas_sp.AAC.1
MQVTNTFAPTLRTLQDARTGAAPWLPVAQGTVMDATGPSPRGCPPVAWANDFVARPPCASQSVSRRNNMCSKRPLSSVKPAAGQTATT